jgi:hypothetical protein
MCRTSWRKEHVTEKVAKIMVGGKQKKWEERDGYKVPLFRACSQFMLLLPPNRSTFSSIYHFPIMPSCYESIKGLLHWLGHSPSDLITSPKAHWLATKCLTHDPSGNISNSNHNTGIWKGTLRYVLHMAIECFWYFLTSTDRNIILQRHFHLMKEYFR